VAVVKPRRQEIPYADDSFYLEQALAPAGLQGGAIRLTSLTPEELAAGPLANFAVVFCVNLPAFNPPAAERLLAYLSTGGHLVWICGQNVQANAYNRMSESAKGLLLPASLGDIRTPAPGGAESWRIGLIDKDHPALAPLAEPASLYQSVLVYKHFPISGNSPETRVLARLDDGQPLLVERNVGAGSVLLLGTGVHVQWTNLPLKPLFLPLVARLTFHLAGAEGDRSQLQAGAPLIVPLGSQADVVELEIARPTGEVVRTRSEPNASAFRYTETHEAGVYLVRSTSAKNPKQFAFAVNGDPDECDSETLSHAELAARFGRNPLVFCEDPADVAGAVQRLRTGKGLWELLLTAVLIGLLAEAFLANRIRGEPAPPKKPEPEVRQVPDEVPIEAFFDFTTGK